MDFIEQLHVSGGVDIVLVVVGSLTKYGHFIPLTHQFSAKYVADVFLDHIFRLHGLPIL